MPNRRDVHLVGITGGIGSGKSLVCSRFELLGRMALQADAIAQEISDSDPEVRRQIVDLLGSAAYRSDGALDRKFVAESVFSKPALLKKLNSVVHPIVIAEIFRRSASLPETKRRPYVLVEAALIYESGMDEMLDYVIVVDAEEELRIRRVMERDHLDRESVQRRIAAQMPATRKVARADFVIRNEGNAVSLDEKVRFIDRILVSMVPEK